MNANYSTATGCTFSSKLKAASLILVLATSLLTGQTESVELDSMSDAVPKFNFEVESKLFGDSEDEERGKFFDNTIIAPVPFKSPAIGWGLALGAGYFLRPAEEGSDEPRSIVGLAGFGSENGSWGVAAGGKFYLKEDTWRVGVLGAYGEVEYRYYGVGNEPGDEKQGVLLRQDVLGGGFEVLKRVKGDWFVGIQYKGFNSITTLFSNYAVLPPELEIPEVELDAFVSGLGFHMQRDTRNDQFYPTAGSLLDFEVDVNDDLFGSDFEYQVYSASWNVYQEINEKFIMATRFFIRYASDDAPFFALSSFGSRGDLRGYQPGLYRDQLMLGGQTEARYSLTERWGVVAFAGVGEVGPTFGSLTWDKLLPAGGGGVRFKLSKKHKINLRFDVAWGKDGEEYYFGVGEQY